jgi:PTH1 family peptidyl-tRNA hydrolase
MESGADAGGGQRPRLIVGLGNPGDFHRETRHNVGFRVVGELARRRGLALSELECNARVGEDGAMVLAQPQTFMNRSGHAVRCLAERRGFLPAEVLAVYDEIHLPLGRLRLRGQGSPAGHRGLESILDSLRTAGVPRLRLGIAGEGAPAGEDLKGYVLSPFEPEEQEAVEAMIGRAADACQAWLAEGIEVAMNRFNG